MWSNAFNKNLLRSKNHVLLSHFSKLEHVQSFQQKSLKSKHCVYFVILLNQQCPKNSTEIGKTEKITSNNANVSTNVCKTKKYAHACTFLQLYNLGVYKTEWGSRDRISWDRNRRSKVLQNFHEIESLILQNCSGAQKGPRGPRWFG